MLLWISISVSGDSGGRIDWWLVANWSLLDTLFFYAASYNVILQIATKLYLKERYMGQPNENGDGYKESSLLSHVSKLEVSFVFFYIEGYANSTV